MSFRFNYTIKEINELCEINSSNYSKKDNWDFINYLDTKNIIKGEINEIQLFDPNYDKVPSRAKRKVKIDDIIISTVRPNQEHYGMIKNKIDNFLVSTGFTTLTVDKTQAYPEFIYYYLTQKYITESLQTIAEQSTTSYPSIKPSDIGNLLIELPPLEIQEKISQILTSIENKITVNKEINKNLEEQLSLIFDDYFIKCSAYEEDSLVKTDWGKIPKEWKNIDFGDLIQITSGDRPDEKSEIKTSEFNIPLFGASKIMGYTKEYSYDEDILIIGRVGTHGVVQRVNYPCFPSDNTFVIKSKYYGFVYQILRRIDYDSLNTGSTQPLITQKSLKTVNVILPDENLLSVFENISQVFFDKIYLNQNEITILTKLRDTLLPKLMSGEIDVSKINLDLE